jgi:hypothetical protein
MLSKIIAFFRTLFFGSPDTSRLPPVNHEPVVINGSSYPSFRLQSVDGTTAEYDLTKKAVEVLNKGCKLAKFKALVLEAKFTETNGLTNDEIYNKLSEHVNLVKVSFFNGSFRQNYIWKTVGLDVGDGVVYVNRHFVTNEKALASLILHETCHKLGFSHFHYKPTSVPYVMNDIIEECMNGL